MVGMKPNFTMKSETMKIYLSASMKIRDLNRKFRRIFPYLKIQLVRYYHEDRFYSDFYPESVSLIEAAGVMKEGEIDIQPLQVVTELVDKLYNNHHLVVYVFRKTVNDWTMIPDKDFLTLEEQNEIGAMAYQSARGMAINN
jgi:hypothetical protein